MIEHTDTLIFRVFTFTNNKKAQYTIHYDIQSAVYRAF